MRDLNDDKVHEILLHDVVVDKDPVQAEEHLLNLGGLRKYLARLRTEKEKNNFKRHLRKYIAMYLPDSPFEVSTTNRYTITTSEACVIARRRIRRGETIKNLSGTLVAVTPDEEKELDVTKRNFSIVHSCRKKNLSMFLGPARFANHDCDPNGRLKTTGSDGMEVVAARNIDVGEEITVSYGEEYFGPNNEDCLCATCEAVVRNGWAPTGTSGIPPQEQSTPDSGTSSHRSLHSLHKKRKHERDSSSETMVAETPHSLKKSKLDHSTLPVLHDSRPTTPPLSFASQSEDSNEAATLLELPVKQPIPKRKLAETGGILTPESMDFPSITDNPEANITTDQPPKKRRRLVDLMVETSPVSVNEPQASIEPSAAAQDPPSAGDHSSAESMKELERSTANGDTNKVKAEDSLQESVQAIPIFISIRQQGENKQLETPDCTQSPHEPMSPAEKATISVSHPIEQQPSPAPSPQKVVESVETVPSPYKPLKAPVSVSASIYKRIPADYKLTSRLLAHSFDRWVYCQTCETAFVQQNGYQTRRECPRCERHSKLYGFGWPKTDKDGRNDKEERIMDHREIHRFIGPDDERQVRRRGRGVVSVSYESSCGTQSTTPERSTERGTSEVSESGRLVRRSRRTWRTTL